MAGKILDRPLSARFTDALVLACDLHRTQSRKGTQIPYVSHLLGVCGLVLEYGGDEDEAIGGLLHDAVEDQGGQPTAATIRERFGDRVADIVLSCTDCDVTPKPPWRQRKEAYVAHLRAATPSALLVSACDKLHNARTILADYREQGEALWSRFSGGRESLWYYRALVDAYSFRGRTPVVEELERIVVELERLCARAQTG
jgi:GTP pyrophosphokinase